MIQLKTLFYKLRFPLAAIVLLGISIGTWWLYDTTRKSDPTVRVQAFLTQLQAGHLQEAKEFFGGGPCPCRVPGGWLSYLIYKSGQEPNLAFLAGRQFSLDRCRVGPETRDSKSPSKRYLELDVPITFSADDRPYFLPLKMAFGSTIGEQELTSFSCQPETDWWKGFSLRLRPSLGKGAIDPPATARLDAKSLNTIESELGGTEQLIQLLGSDVVECLSPADAGTVTTRDGSSLTDRQIEAKLPRLSRVTMHFYMTRQEPSPVWFISNCKPFDPIIESGAGKSLALKMNAESAM